MAVYQRKFVDILGPYNEATDSVSGRFIVRRTGGKTRVATAKGTFECDDYRVLWSFDTDYAARASFEFWKQESHAAHRASGR